MATSNGGVYDGKFIGGERCGEGRFTGPVGAAGVPSDEYIGQWASSMRQVTAASNRHAMSRLAT